MTDHAAPEATPQPVSQTKRDYSKRHSISQRTLDNWVSAGMPVLRVSTRKLLFPIEDCDAWIREKFLISRRRRPSSRITRPIPAPILDTDGE